MKKFCIISKLKKFILIIKISNFALIISNPHNLNAFGEENGSLFLKQVKKLYRILDFYIKIAFERAISRFTWLLRKFN